MRLLAVKIGVGVPTEPFSGLVRSVFVNAAILVVADKLVTLAPTAGGGLPGGITVDVPTGFNFAGTLRIGAVAVSRAGILRFAGNAASIDLRVATAWRSQLCDLRLDLAAPAAERAWIAIAAALLSDGRSAAIARLARAAMDELSQATRSFSLRAAEQAAERLVGLGAGGTPAGDDFLVGYLAGLFSSAGTDCTRTNFAVAFANTCHSMGKHTNDISRAYLEAAAGGQSRNAWLVSQRASPPARPSRALRKRPLQQWRSAIRREPMGRWGFCRAWLAGRQRPSSPEAAGSSTNWLEPPPLSNSERRRQRPSEGAECPLHLLGRSAPYLSPCAATLLAPTGSEDVSLATRTPTT